MWLALNHPQEVASLPLGQVTVSYYMSDGLKAL